MREMKDSGIAWIGEIPKEWEIGRFKNICKIKSGDSLSNELICDEDIYPVYGGGTDSLGCYNKYNTYSEEIIVGRVGARCGCVTLPKCKCWATDNALIVHTNLDVVFSYYLLCGFDLNRLNTSNAQPLITSSKINESFICIPPLSEQQRIATFLDEKCKEIDALIALQEEMITELQAYKQSVISEAVTKGLAPKVPMKDSGVEWIGEIPEHWNLCKTLYGLIMPITDGPHTTPNLYKEGVPFVSAEAVSTGKGKIDFNHIRGYISEEFYKECCKKYIPALDDIYMIKSGATTGRVAIVNTNKQFTIWSPLAVFRCNTSIMKPKYLFYQLQSNGYQKQIELGWSYGTQQNIGMRTLETLLITIPPLPEQQAIADYLDTQCTRIDSLIAIKQEKIESLKEYKKSVIYEYVTGKKEVPATV